MGVVKPLKNAVARSLMKIARSVVSHKQYNQKDLSQPQPASIVQSATVTTPPPPLDPSSRTCHFTAGPYSGKVSKSAASSSDTLASDSSEVTLVDGNYRDSFASLDEDEYEYPCKDLFNTSITIEDLSMPSPTEHTYVNSLAEKLNAVVSLAPGVSFIDDVAMDSLTLDFMEKVSMVDSDMLDSLTELPSSRRQSLPVAPPACRPQGHTPSLSTKSRHHALRVVSYDVRKSPVRQLVHAGRGGAPQSAETETDRIRRVRPPRKAAPPSNFVAKVLGVPHALAQALCTKPKVKPQPLALAVDPSLPTSSCAVRTQKTRSCSRLNYIARNNKPAKAQNQLSAILEAISTIERYEEGRGVPMQVDGNENDSILMEVDDEDGPGSISNKSRKSLRENAAVKKRKRPPKSASHIRQILSLH